MNFLRYCSVLVIMSFLCCHSAFSENVKSLDKSYKTQEMDALLNRVVEMITASYVDDIDKDTLKEGMMRGMLSSLDPHSEYLNRKEYDDILTQIGGSFGGVGVEIMPDNGFAKVVNVLENSPAAKAGLMSGDFITSIDDEGILGMPIDQISKRIKGEVGTEIKIIVLRKESKVPLVFKIKRGIVEVHAVKLQTYDINDKDSVLVVKISTFITPTTQQVVKDVEKAIQILAKQNRNMLGVVLDLRNNLGGALEQALGVSNLFLSDGDIVSVKGRTRETFNFNLEDETSFNAGGKDRIKRVNTAEGVFFKAGKYTLISPDVPMVVLINEVSASASEIVAGALKDNKRALIVGQKSFGKGSVQSVTKIDDDNGAIKLTTARYYTPSGKSIQASGIEPDIKVLTAKFEPSKSEEMLSQIVGSEAKLADHLINEQLKEEHTKQQQRLGGEDKKITDISNIKEKDYQLGAAVEILQTVSVSKNLL